MMQQLGEDLIEIFNGEHLRTINQGPLAGEFRKVELRRTKNLDLELEITLPGWVDREEPKFVEGEFYEAMDTMEFSNAVETIYKSSGMIQLRRHTRSTADGEHTTFHYSIHAMEMQVRHSEEPSYVIEWVCNLSSRLIGNSNLHDKDMEISRIRFGTGAGAIRMVRTKKYDTYSRILHINIDGNDIYLVNKKESQSEKESKSGYIVYGGAIDQRTRTKIRQCISFILGLPIVVLGYTEYSVNGSPLYMRSFPAQSFGGRAFELKDLPPYPIASGSYRNSPDIHAIETAINALYMQYELLKFDELSWTYWHGACASATMSAVYFGGLCEQLQRVVTRSRKMEGGTLINKDTWKEIERLLIDIIDPIDLGQIEKSILKNKISALNQLPQSVALDRMLRDLGLSVSDAERSAWRHRNSAAHGAMRGSSDDIILNSRLLRLMFHRILGAVTSCSKHYVDYYSLGFPTRCISEEIPLRQSV